MFDLEGMYNTQNDRVGDQSLGSWQKGSSEKETSNSHENDGLVRCIPRRLNTTYHLGQRNTKTWTLYKKSSSGGFEMWKEDYGRKMDVSTRWSQPLQRSPYSAMVRQQYACICALRSVTIEFTRFKPIRLQYLEWISSGSELKTCTIKSHFDSRIKVGCQKNPDPNYFTFCWKPYCTIAPYLTKQGRLNSLNKICSFVECWTAILPVKRWAL